MRKVILLLAFVLVFVLTVRIVYSDCPPGYYCDNTQPGGIRVCSVSGPGTYNGSFSGPFSGTTSKHNWTLATSGSYVNFTASILGEENDWLNLYVYLPNGSFIQSVGPGSSKAISVCSAAGTYNTIVEAYPVTDSCAPYNITFNTISVGCCQNSDCNDAKDCSLDVCSSGGCLHCTQTGYNVSTCNYYPCCSGLQQCFDGVCRVACPDFNISLNPTSLSITVPQSGYNSSKSTINVSSINGFNSPVTFSGSWIGSSPTGVTFYFTPNSVTPPANGNAYANVTINVSSIASIGTYTLRINATSGFLSKYVDLTVNILPSPAAPFDFNVSVSPSSGSVVQGSWINATVIVTLLSGTPQTVYLYADNCPPAATCSFLPSNSGTPTYSRTLNISTSYSTPNGTYQITIRGVAGSLTKTATYTLRISPSSNCVRANPVVIISPTYGYGSAGQTLTYTVNVTNRDSTACGESTFSLVGIVPEGFSYSFSQTTLVIKPVGFSNTNTSYLYVTSNCTSKDNYPHTIRVNATNTNAPNYFASNTSYYYVYQHFYVSVTPSSKSGISGSTLSYNIQLTNNKWTTCPATTFTFTGNVPAGWSYTITPQVTLSSGSTTTAPTFNITSPCTAVPRNYFINVTANDTLTGIARTSSSSNYTVINPSCNIQATPFFSTGPFSSTLTATFYNLNTTCFSTATLNCGNETIVNLAYNPSFEGKTWQIDENNTNFEDWDISRSPDNGIIKTWVETSNAHSGNKALHWKTEAPSSTNLSLSYYSNNSKRFVIDENKYLEAGLWSYVIAGSSGSDVSFYFWDSNGNYLGRFWGRDKLEGWVPNQWRRVSYVWYPSSMGSGNGFIPKGAKYARLNIYANWHEGGIKERIDDDVFVRQFDDLSARSLQISGNQISTTCYYPSVSNISYYRAFANVSANTLVSCPTTIVDTPNTFDFTVSVSPTPNYNRLVGFWPFDEGWGISSADKSGYGNNASLGVTKWEYVPAWTLGKFGYGLGFDGIDDRVRINNVPVNTSAGAYNTVAFWMYWNGNDNQMPFGWQQAYGLWVIGGCFGFNTGENNVLGISSSGLANRWVHVVAIFYNGVPSSTTVALYIDGVKQSIFACRGSTTASRSVTSTLQISGWAYSTGYYFGGIIDELKIWNRALSDEEVLAEYQLAKVAQGQKHFANVSATLLTGNTQPVILDLTGCPPNAECTLIPNISNPTYNSILTVSTSAQTPVGSYNITIRGTSGSLTKEMNYTVGVVAFCVRSNPSLIISPSLQQGEPGKELSYSVHLTNEDSSACPASTFTIEAQPLFNADGWKFDNASWLSGWKYRQTITIDNTASGNALTDYQILVVLNTTSLISQGKMNSDCSDIRFTDSYGTLINYWLESGCNSANTKIWVKVPFIPASSTQPIYLYYGNTTPVNSASSVNDTFISNSIFLVTGRCTAGTYCGYADNHAEFDYIRERIGISPFTVDGSGYVSKINHASNPYGSSDYYYSRYRFLYIPATSGTYSFGTNSDDASEVTFFPSDGYGGGLRTTHPYGEHEIVAYWYGGHGTGTCGVSGTINSRSLVAGQGYWIDYMQEEWGGGQLAQMCINIPGVGWTIVDATNANFANRIFARKYTTPEPIVRLGIVLNPQESIATDLRVNSSATASGGDYKFNITASSATGSTSATGTYLISTVCQGLPDGTCIGELQVCRNGIPQNSCGDAVCNCNENEYNCPNDCTYVHYMLRKDWHLISLPYKRIINITVDGCGAKNLSFFYYENYTWKKIVGMMNIKGGYGYWVNPSWFTKAQYCTINLTVDRSENISLEDIPKLKKGFNAIGATYEDADVSSLKCVDDLGNQVPIRVVYYWDVSDPFAPPQWKVATSIKQVPPWYYGYWIYVDEDCKLTK